MDNVIPHVFYIDDDLKIREEMLSIHSINPFVPNLSAARAYMSSSHLSQIITLRNGDEKILQSGIEKQFGANTFSKKTEKDVRVINIVSRYNGISSNSVNATTELVVIVEDMETGEVDTITIPQYFSLHQYFGFRYVKNKVVLDNITIGSILPKGTILADSPSVTSNSGYKFGLNANVALVTIPEVSEDGVVISKDFAKRLSYDIFETRVVEFGENKFPLNIYGDSDNYKPFPEIGDTINQDSVIMVLRDYDPRLAASLTSVKDVQEFNPIFDEAHYVKSPGKELELNGGRVLSGEIIDIKAYSSPKFKREVYTGTADSVHKYINGMKKFYQDIIDVYDSIQREHYARYRNNDVKISEAFHKLLIDAYAIVNEDVRNIKYSFRNEALDIYRIEFTVKYTIIPGVGAKITDLSGILISGM